MYYINLVSDLLKEIVRIANEKKDVDLAEAIEIIDKTLQYAKFEEQGLLCNKCGLAISEEMSEITQGMCQCNH